MYVIVQTTLYKEKTGLEKPTTITGYILFTKEKRKKVAEANPDFNGPDLFKVTHSTIGCKGMVLVGAPRPDI